MNFNKIWKEKKSFLLTKNNIYLLLFIIIIFAADRYLKLLVLNKSNLSSYIVNDYLNIDLIWNTGIGFGLLSTGTNLIYNSISFLVGTVILILFYLLFISKGLDKIIYSLIIGGALGNFCDRIIFKAVPDFIDLHYNSFHWFTFNLADVFISLGVIIFIIKGFFIKT